MKRLVFIITDTAGSAYSAIAEEDFALLVNETADGGGGGLIDETFTTVLKFDKNYTSEHTITGANAFTLDSTGALKGNISKIYMRANGVNKPTFSADFVMQRDNWVNTNNVWNILHFEYTPSNKVSVWITYQ